MTTFRLLAILSITLSVIACANGDDTTASSDGDQGSSSSAGLPKGDIARGKELAGSTALTGQSCVSCHGEEGNAPIDPSYPKIGGQYHDYIAHALQRYRDGKREHALMTPQATKLSDQQIADVSAYFGSRPSQLQDMSAH
ncbi:cytochrome c [Lysobacter pythonis]|uniref:Cytochrome c n=1 Tax=Solilutibacter pythonis TaxID=2483112 RepID=A0A3M2I3W8_9GAMM|nr:cytochrome c [Lysobacter pythonis]